MGHQLFTGTVDTVLFPKAGQSSEKGFTIFKMSVEGRKEPVTVKGHCGDITPGQCLEVIGTVTHNARYQSDELEVIEWRETIPQTDNGLASYLKTFDGLGPAKAGALVRYFGAPGLLAALDENPRKLAKVPGISIALAESIGLQWEEKAKQRDVMLFCAKHQLTPYQAQQIWKKYKERSIDILQQNPYQVADDIEGFGFKKADEIAHKLGIARLDSRRIAAGLLFALSQAERDGHCYLPYSVWVELAAGDKVLGLNEAVVEEEAKLLVKGSVVIADTEFRTGRGTTPIYRPVRFGQESRCAKTIAHMLTAPAPSTAGLQMLGVEVPDETQLQPVDRRPGDPEPDGAKIDQVLKHILSNQKIDLSDQQVAAIRLALSKPIALITGLPGTGKSTSMRVTMESIKALGRDVYACAPTGRAAKRLSETSGFDASTIHRMLQYHPEFGWRVNEREPLFGHAIVIMDEVSMLDLELFGRVLAAMKPTDRLLLVGDPHQLPSVGPGNVLADLIAVPGMPHSHLTQIFRQAESSMIITNAHRINRGETPLAEPLEGQRSDFLLLHVHGAAEAAALNAQRAILDMVGTYGERAMESVQVITPMHDGAVGTKALNVLLQDTINPLRPGLPSLKIGDREIRQGDRVMQMRNKYKVGELPASPELPGGRDGTPVFNGDLGYVIAIDQEKKTCVVNIEGTGHVHYTSKDLSDLYLAYAITIHKSQGSEYPVVIIPLTSQHYVMLQRTLLYTAVTRARQQVVLIAEPKALAIAVGREQTQKRWTGLTQRIGKLIAERV